MTKDLKRMRRTTMARSTVATAPLSSRAPKLDLASWHARLAGHADHR